MDDNNRGSIGCAYVQKKKISISGFTGTLILIFYIISIMCSIWPSCYDILVYF